MELEFDKLNLPDYPVPESYTLETYLKEIAQEGLIERFEELDRLGTNFDKTTYEKRLDEELGIIKRMGYPG